MRFCKTTLWIKKSSFENNDMTLRGFGPSRALSEASERAFEGREWGERQRRQDAPWYSLGGDNRREASDGRCAESNGLGRG